MNEFIGKADLAFAHFTKTHIRTPRLIKFLSKVNKGETLAVCLLPVIFFLYPWKQALWMLLHVGVTAFFTDRLVLVIKKYVSRKRPLLQVLDSKDPNPDMKHSFPSAHAANSMVVVTILVLGYSFHPLLFLVSLFAGLGRLITLHHFLSDVSFGWFMGFVLAYLSIFLVRSF